MVKQYSIILLMMFALLSNSCLVSISDVGVPNKLARFSEAMLIEPSSISDNGSHVSVNGTLVLNEVVWDDLQINASQARLPASLAPTARTYLQSQVLGFSPTAVNVIYFSAQLPHGYKEGTNLEFHIHLAYPDALSGNSTWYFSYSWADDDEAFPVPSEVTKVVVSPATANRHQLAEIESTIVGTGKRISSVLLCSIQRLGNDGDDTYPSEIYLVSADFHYQKDTIGSKYMLGK